MIRAHRIFFTALVVLAATGLRPAAQVRDNNNTVTRVGTGVIAGRVWTDESAPRPLRRANVTLATGELKIPSSIVTDDAGAFAFTALPPGNYTLIASRTGYVSTFYGGKNPGRGPGVPIALLDGQRVENLAVKMIPGGVISGTLHSPSGRVVSNVEVQVQQIQNVNGQRRLATMAPTLPWTTDDRGQYRAYGLAPGDYIVMARPTIADARRITDAEVSWAQRVTTQAASAAGVPPPALPPAPEPSQPLTYVSVYYPGTVDSAAALPVTLSRGEEKSGIDFIAVLVPTAKISGTVIDADGQPVPGVQVSLKAPQAEVVSQMDMISQIVGGLGGGGRSGADGKFSLTGIKPGPYTIQARGVPPRTGGPGGPGAPGGRGGAGNAADVQAIMSIMLPGGGSGGASAMLWAQDDLSVNGRDVSDLVLRLQPGMTVSGRLGFQVHGEAKLPEFSQARVSLAAPPTGNGPMEMVMSLVGAMTGMAGVAPGADGAFTLNGVTPGKYRVTPSVPGMAAGTSGTWTLLSVMFDGLDVSDAPLDVRPNMNVSGLAVAFTDRPTELSGSVQDAAGRVTANYPIVVFSTDKRYWAAGSRRVKQARPASDGKFTITGLPPGEYFVCALTDLDPNALGDAGFLEQLAGSSFKITLADGEKKVQSLKIGG